MASSEAETTVACTECGAADAIQIELSLPDGTVVLFCSCHRCENRWWNSDGQDIHLETVLKLARKAAEK